MRRWLLCVVVCFATLTPAASSAATAGSGFSETDAASTLKGRVVDSTGGAVAGALVSITSERPGAPVTSVTNGEGEFSVSVGPGAYTVRVAAAGFGDASRSVTVGQAETSLDFTLEIEGFQETVTVGAPLGYAVQAVSSATKTTTLLRDVPQAMRGQANRNGQEGQPEPRPVVER